MDVLGGLSDGDVIKAVVVAKGATGPNGTFVLRSDPSVPLDEFRENDGTLNFSLYGNAGDQVAAFAFSRRNSDGRWVALDGIASDAPGLEAKLSLSGASSRAASDESGPAPTVDKWDGGCGIFVRATYNDRKGLVGEVYTGPHANADFTYQNGSSSELGVGISANGTFGSFSQSGTMGGSSTSGINYPTQGTNKLKVFQTSWQYKKFQYYAFDLYMNCYSEGFEVRPTMWWGSSYEYNTPNPPTATYCSNQLSGASMWKNQGTAITFTNGLDLTGPLGLSLSTRTGFNSETKHYWTFVSAGKLCGSNTTWPYAARVVAK